MNYATLKNSRRLQRVLSHLKAMGRAGATTRGIIIETGSVAVNSCIAELRAQGFVIECRFERRTPSGASVYRYFLR